MIRSVLYVVLAASLAFGVSACGFKGRLKSPTQIEAAEAKKARKDSKKTEEQKKQAPELITDEAQAEPQ